jgi:glucose uptake protein GlcU
MSFIALIVAVLCGIALLINLDTGDLTDKQVMGIAIIALVVAGIAPAATWPWKRE